MAANYDYVVHEIKKSCPHDGRFLDFGCGAGQIVERGIEEGLDYYGADPYAANYSGYHDQAQRDRVEITNKISKIENGILPFPDNYFDAVSSNMVFEHVENIEQCLSEIHRVLKPGGLFLALFPTKDTWWEGHARVYFAHWMKPHSKCQYYYLKTLYALGFGKKIEGKDPQSWAENFQNYFATSTFYRPSREIKQLWQTTFGTTPTTHQYDYMLFRIQQHKKLVKLLPYLKNPVGRFLLTLIGKIRAGQILRVYKAS